MGRDSGKGTAHNFDRSWGMNVMVNGQLVVYGSLTNGYFMVNPNNGGYEPTSGIAMVDHRFTGLITTTRDGLSSKNNKVRVLLPCHLETP